MLNQQWLMTFMTLVEVGHFTHTAHKLFMTQPGVSQHIKKLEQQVGAPLLQRIGKRFELTAAGEILYRYARQRAIDETQLLSQLQTDHEYVGDCRFGCSGAIASLLYPHFLEYQRQHSGLTVTMEAAPNKRIVTAILDNQLDIGIVTRVGDEVELSYEAIGHAPLSLVLPSQYRDQVLDIELLNRIGFINHPDGEYYLQQVLQTNFQTLPKGAVSTTVAAQDFSIQSSKVASIRRTGYVNQLSQILLPVSKGLGFTVLPQSTVDAFIAQESLWSVRLAQSVREAHYLVHKSHRPLPRRYHGFIDLIGQLIGKQVG
ncbi:LysR family transcriptional regulator [Shewanella sp. HN-41]|uniref:LysR family transcriptional regulator n=1 Tax=Shewanella sp. HN-41 TaxID=327275 RepID=UPI0002125DCD|nr:LysR family transcriptional regulator [Shewanella sp. HN-41]EGM70489.1 transcriptional regulator, LysR family [Shewanella sp. HN-41]